MGPHRQAECRRFGIRATRSILDDFDQLGELLQVGPILKRKHRHQRDHCEIAVDEAPGMASVLRIITIGMGQQRGERLRLRQRRQPRTFDLIILSQQED